VPSPDLLIKIADHGKVTLDWLLTGKGGSKKFSMGPKGKKGKKRR
jgi:hypothetical protein